MKMNPTPPYQSERSPLRVSLSKSLRKMADSQLFIVLSFLEHLTKAPIQLLELRDDADISFVSNLDIKRKSFAQREWQLSKSEPSLEKIMRRISNSRVSVLVSFENLQHPAWVGLGKLIMQSELPRITFFPQTIDPRGVRLPYWWNFLDWPQFPRPAADYQRYGRLYDLKKLVKPIPLSEGRVNRACWVGSYSSEPRSAMLRHAESMFGLDIFGEAGTPIQGPKVSVLEKYRFTVGAENSLGIGYDTEKIPEAWDSGCIPVSTFLQPFSDFNPLALDLRHPEQSNRHPLLLSEPEPGPVLDYLERILNC